MQHDRFEKYSYNFWVVSRKNLKNYKAKIKALDSTNTKPSLLRAKKPKDKYYYQFIKKIT